MNDTLYPLFVVTALLEKLDVDYFLTGSLASASYGATRSTLDADLVARLQAAHIAPFVSALEDDFYVVASMLEGAIERRSSFNILHNQTMLKVDIFVSQDDGFSAKQFERCVKRTLDDAHSQTVYMSTPEDVILSKLRWFRQGNEVSEQQWRDVIGIMGTLKQQLDEDYLTTWAANLNVSDLLERAWGETTHL